MNVCLFVYTGMPRVGPRRIRATVGQYRYAFLNIKYLDIKTYAAPKNLPPLSKNYVCIYVNPALGGYVLYL